ncbi:hypothetical protein [Dysosmobacter sp.]|uniref:hypothetical protein n=1 Tax=Dysosmobacter sp. TaxID=2591382 RepID=UPI002A89739F|nr:hypothetical protein [Dysosmobacter sp.]MDY3281542.1 hypothetical protein [Dysosmobacter sp.]
MGGTSARPARRAAALILAALVSMFVLSRFAASPEFHRSTTDALDEKRTTVMELAAAATAASAAITLLPGDAATPIADKLADLSAGFLLVLCAIYLEKYLTVLTGYASFAFLIPLACGLLAVNAFRKSGTLRSISLRLLALAAAIFLVVPASVQASNLIESVYDASIQSTLDSARETTQAIEDQAEGTETDQGLLSGLLTTVKEGVSGAVEAAENVLNRFIEALAVMIVTACVIPVLVLLFFVWVIKVLLGTAFPPPRRDP